MECARHYWLIAQADSSTTVPQHGKELLHSVRASTPNTPSQSTFAETSTAPCKCSIGNPSLVRQSAGLSRDGTLSAQTCAFLPLDKRAVMQCVESNGWEPELLRKQAAREGSASACCARAGSCELLQHFFRERC